jgi:ADP-ribose pyrophosphatase YjhB (NUDIX family)
MPTLEKNQEFKNPYPATDIIIEYSAEGKSGIVLIERKNYPYGIALPGGFAEYGLSLEDNAVNEAKEETGLEVIIENPEHPICVHSKPGRDPRAHIISLTYVAKGYGQFSRDDECDDAKNPRVYSIEEVEDLLKDSSRFAFNSHARAIGEYLAARRNK